MEEILAQHQPQDCEEGTVRELTKLYPHMLPEQRIQLQQVQGSWPTFREQWQMLSEAEKAELRKQFSAMFQQQSQQPQQPQHE
jgi:hypothetical protein